MGVRKRDKRADRFTMEMISEVEAGYRYFWSRPHRKCLLHNPLYRPKDDINFTNPKKKKKKATTESDPSFHKDEPQEPLSSSQES